MLDKMNEEMNRADKKQTIEHENPPSEQGAEKEEEPPVLDADHLLNKVKKDELSEQTKLL